MMGTMQQIPRHLVGWFVAGLATATFLVCTQALALGGVAGLLQVGESSKLRPVIEQQLGPIPLVPGGGHDGQVSYAIGLDLDLNELADEVGEPGYRHRRILFPLVASLGGLLEGRALLYGMLATAAVGMGLATAAMADLSVSLGLSRWVTAGVLASPGAWLTVRVLTPDALALGLVLAALAAFARRKNAVALVLVTAAVLTKDQSLVTALAVAVWLVWDRRIRAAVWFAAFPTAALAAWSAAVSRLVGDGFTPRGNLDLPFAGILDSISAWSIAPASDVALGMFMILIVLASLVVAFRLRATWVGFQLAAWAMLAMVSSVWVWEFGNNVARAFAPLTALLAVGIGWWAQQNRPLPAQPASTSRRNLPV